VSSTAGFTIGTSPWDKSCRSKRQAAASGLNKASVDKYIDIIHTEVKELIRDFYMFSEKGKIAIEPKKFLQKYALNVSLVVNYGTRMNAVSDELFTEITDTELQISNFRSTSYSYQDYLPILRYLPAGKKQALADQARKRRDVYMSKLLDTLRDQIASGNDRSCITGTILKDPAHKLTPAELSSICLSMVSAGLDTLGSTLYWSVGHLATHPDLQTKAYEAILAVHGEKGLDVYSDKDVPYISALHKEASRFFTVLKLGLSRKTISDSNYENHFIPAGTTVFYNSFAMNHDPQKFKNPEEFNPERFLDGSAGDDEMDHFGFGVGRRLCVGKGLAEREMYIAFGELIQHFEMKRSEIPAEQQISTNPRTDTVNPTGLAHHPLPYYVRFVPRNPEKLEAWLNSSD